MNNKGFTMIELLIVISLIALMAILMAVNMTGILSEQKGMSYNTIRGQIESAACAYIDKQENVNLRKEYKDNSSGGLVILSTLIKDGLIDGEMKDPRTNKTLEEEGNDIRVRIKWVNKEKQCMIEE